MATALPSIETSPSASGGSPSARRRTTVNRNDVGDGGPSGPQVAHTLTACSRCRQRKTRCDPGLPRCGPCQKTNSLCEYYDANKGHNVNRGYVVYLQHRVRALEEDLARVESEDAAEDPEAMMRAANVRLNEAKDPKFLGPSSGIAITRLVMQLAKQFTDAKSIKEIVPEQRARQIKELYHQEQAKPTSKVYPLISDVAAVDLPRRDLTNVLLQLYKLRVQPMYPALHEPSLDKDIDAVYRPGSNPSAYQHFICRMVIAISLQKLDTQYAGLADSYYLAALQYLEPVVKPMDLQTLQCFALMGEYSLLTPTRTAVYYVVGLAVRLAQALGFHEEKSIIRMKPDKCPDLLEIDMRRRLYWCTLVMEFGLAHSLGRPAMLATRQEHINVGWFETCDDEYITPSGIDPTAPRPTLKKWVAIHFFKMRLLQLEIRRKLYLRKRPTPRSDKDKWFVQMHAKLTAWRDAAPSADEKFGLDKIWFIGRYNTMVVFLFRPSPQVPRPSLDAALKCFDACEYNIYMQRDQLIKKNVDLTWAFTQSLFMNVNTMLWALSYEEVRRKHNREAVENHLKIAMYSIQLASERWPGVASAVQLYYDLITAIMKIYEKDGDVPISAASPTDTASPGLFVDPQNRSRGASPATASSSSVATPPEQRYGNVPAERNVEQLLPMTYQPESSAQMATPHTHSAVPAVPPMNTNQVIDAPLPPNMATFQQPQQRQHPQYFDPYTQFNSLPQFTPDITVPGWTAPPRPSVHFATANAQPTYNTAFHNAAALSGADSYANHPAFDPNNSNYPFPSTELDENPMYTDRDMSDAPFLHATAWDTGDVFSSGLTQTQQEELMLSLETQGMEDIQSMIASTLASITPKTTQDPTF